MGAAALIAATGLTVTAATPAQAATTWPTTPAAWASDDRTVMELGADGTASVAFPGLATAAGSSPAVAMLDQFTDNCTNGCADRFVRALAVHAANTNTMKYSDDTTGTTLIDSGVAMATGASPAIASMQGGTAEIVFVRSDNMLLQLDNSVGTSSYPTGVPRAVSAGTNPSVAGNLENRYEIAFHASGGTLCYVDRDNAFHDTGIQMAPGSSPSITSMGGGPDFKIAFAGTDNLLRVYDTVSGAITQFTPAVEPGTSPVIASQSSSGQHYKVAFQAKDMHDLWTVTSENVWSETSRPMASGTSPSIVVGTSDGLYQVLVNDAATHTVWALGTFFLNTGMPIAAGTNPSTSGTVNSGGLTPFGPAIDPPKAPFLQAFADKVIVNWVDLSTAELEFDVQKYDSRGLWTTVNVTPTRDSAGRGNPYAWTDTDQSISGQCYRIVATNGFRFGYSPVSCTVRTPSDIPLTIPGGTAQWSGLSSVNGDLGTLFNSAASSDHYLNRSHRITGVDLDFQGAPAYWQAQAEGGPQLMKGQALALYDPTGNGGYLTLGNPDFGINLGFSSTPSYEWYAIGGGHPGDPLGSGGNFALWNSRQRDFLIMPSPCSAGVGVVNLVWASKSDCSSSTPPPDPGVRWYQMYNCSANGQTVSVWIQDATLNLPYAFKGHLAATGCGPSQGSVPFNFDPPADNHVYRVVAVDTTRNGCTADDPTNGFCQALLGGFLSNRKSDLLSAINGGQPRWQGYLMMDAVNGNTTIATCTPDICGDPPTPQPGGGPSGASSVALAANANGRLEMFGVNPAGVMFHRGQQTAGGSGWGGWVQSATRDWESVAAATNAAGRIELVGLSTSGDVHRRTQAASNAPSWFNWTQLTGSLHSAAVAANQNGQLEMFGTNTYGQAFYSTQDSPGSSAWGPWQQLVPPAAASDIVATTTVDHRIEVFVLDQFGNVWRSAQTAANQNTWGPFSEFDGPNMVSIAAARNSDGRVELIGLDNNGNPWRRAELTAGSDVWDQQWAALPTITSLAYLAVATNPSNNLIQIDAVNQQGQIWQSVQQSASSGQYTPWTQIDGTLRP